MRLFSCPRITAHQIHPLLLLNSSHHFPKFFCLNTTTAMSDNLKSQSSSSTLLTTAAKKQEGVEASPPPPPPEKPLPGDCCGSGCVRCVWDIYYEELEEYNNLYKNKPLSVTSPDDINPKPS